MSHFAPSIRSLMKTIGKTNLLSFILQKKIIYNNPIYGMPIITLLPYHSEIKQQWSSLWEEEWSGGKAWRCGSRGRAPIDLLVPVTFDIDIWTNLGLLVRDGGVHNNIVPGNPVDRSSDPARLSAKNRQYKWKKNIPVLVTSLERVNTAENLGSVTSGRGGIREDETDGLLGIDYEDGANGESDALGIDICGVLVVDPMENHIRVM
jgi:hypothetical protein